MVCDCNCKWQLIIMMINDFVIDNVAGWNQDKDGGYVL